MGNISGKQVREVIRLYSSNSSILETARAASLSTVKVRGRLDTSGILLFSGDRDRGDLLFQSFRAWKNYKGSVPHRSTDAYL